MVERFHYDIYFSFLFIFSFRLFMCIFIWRLRQHCLRTFLPHAFIYRHIADDDGKRFSAITTATPMLQYNIVQHFTNDMLPSKFAFDHCRTVHYCSLRCFSYGIVTTVTVIAPRRRRETPCPPLHYSSIGMQCLWRR